MTRTEIIRKLEEAGVKLTSTQKKKMKKEALTMLAKDNNVALEEVKDEAIAHNGTENNQAEANQKEDNEMANNQVEVNQAENNQVENKENEPKTIANPALMAAEVADKVGGQYIPVKPNGHGVKVGKARAFALYTNRAKSYRLKSNKVFEILDMLNEYDVTIKFSMTSDGRDCLLDFPLDDDLVLTFCTELASKSFARKKPVRKPKAEKTEAADTVQK